MLNPFPSDKFQTLPNQKSVQTTILNLMKTVEKLSKRVENNEGAIFPIPTVILKDLNCRHVKTRACLGKGLKHLQDDISLNIFRCTPSCFFLETPLFECVQSYRVFSLTVMILVCCKTQPYSLKFKKRIVLINNSNRKLVGQSLKYFRYPKPLLQTQISQLLDKIN